jgi:ligand-binding sensor domain-containing protein
VSGIDFDRNGNMWVSNFGAANPLSVRTASGQWLSVPFPTGADLLVGYVTCDDNNNKWVMSTRGNGIMLVNDGGNPLNLQGYQFKQLTKDETTGRLPSNTVICMTKDANGEMWVGTDQGLCIFSNPANAFSKEFGSRQIIIKTGLVNSIFLGTEPIYCIRVDAANRKWIGTRNGVWLVSEDGYTVIRNFNTKNSPLLSDVVYDICINGETGEVFFATEKGIISYAGTATDGTDKHGDVVVFPNPVRPEYTGLIAIRGLVQNANVKITDIAGNLVYETKANGGMATWDGRNFNGKRASTGVYIIYSSDKDGMETWAGKILFVN